MGALIDFVNKLLNKDDVPSKDLAKERLRLVLVHDRATLSPELLMTLKEELINVLTKYLEIDVAGLEVNLDRADDTVALVANIPVKSVRRA
ncbi:MAG: cell division topological specificity factor MinE [Firmicutes bacterium]|nr:cell division topological specificity factor MinE [Bacillota bacterium]